MERRRKKIAFKKAYRRLGRHATVVSVTKNKRVFGRSRRRNALRHRRRLLCRKLGRRLDFLGVRRRPVFHA